jgi:5-methylcytosine-specific restriction endonuclease McrBC regulatory subunit McrC
MNSLTIKEYKPCETHFFIPENKYSKFKAFCTKKDNKDVKKLQIKTIQKKYDGKNVREIELTATSYVGVFHIPDKDNSTLIVRPKIGSTAFLQMLHYINEQDIIIQNIFAHGMQESSDFVSMFIHFLIKTIYELLISSKRKGYDLVNRDLLFIKGRVNYLKTIKNRARSSNLITCEYFQFNSSTLINKAIKFTLLQIRDIIPPKSIRF